ncbi:TetR/AcrR family transcriptional regulator [Microbulbifer rhizosphaerae]|uniref:AcrR family transcriptional regulator n=1 Tax=Microbulbifer rhizosphaerae TaxID=1562603 RepID=A0A7W4Z7S7_9GAMM|nr:TetR/AcrR family transcriptional regulator [Microbulbifer rhizosphaerae]MBB3059817.1 AcrR family transcriptional regulator [Microbulbifer rhizosphaerae]
MDAKTLILDHAVRHFAEKGYDGVSLREISRDAGLNAALVHYHFGNKEAVYREVISRYLKALNEQRLENLRRIDPNLKGKRRIEALIRGYISPHLELCGDEKAHAYVRLLARFVMESHSLTDSIYTELLMPIRNQYLLALRETAPNISTDAVVRVFSFAVMLMITAPFDGSYRTMSGRDAWPEEPEDLIDQIVGFTVAGIADLAEASGAGIGKLG